MGRVGQAEGRCEIGGFARKERDDIHFLINDSAHTAEQ